MKFIKLNSLGQTSQHDCVVYVDVERIMSISEATLVMRNERENMNTMVFVEDGRVYGCTNPIGEVLEEIKSYAN